tara:strand:- start:1145 stop:1507 length:363 start_codon:yes stop_codon:yes gene_type:complete
MAWTAKQNEEIERFLKKNPITVAKTNQVSRPLNLVEAEKRRLLLLHEIEKAIRISADKVNENLCRSQLSAMRYIYNEEDKNARTEAVKFHERIGSDERLIGIMKNFKQIINKKHYSTKGK